MMNEWLWTHFQGSGAGGGDAGMKWLLVSPNIIRRRLCGSFPSRIRLSSRAAMACMSIGNAVPFHRTVDGEGHDIEVSGNLRIVGVGRAVDVSPKLFGLKDLLDAWLFVSWPRVKRVLRL
jgi:hypothetical protein